MSDITGTSSSDNLNGGSGDDIIDGGAGNDKLSGGAGADTLNGGTGNDTLVGGSGNDILDGDSGSDTLNGDSGNDTLIYNLSENLSGGSTSDVYTGGSGIDKIVVQFADLAQWQSTSNNAQAQVQSYLAKLAAVTNATTGEVSNGTASDFKFQFGPSTTLTVQMIEKLEVWIGNVKIIDSTDHSAATIVPDLDAGSDSGISTDNITNDSTPTINGVGAEPLATVKVFDGAILLGTTTALLNGTWLFTPATALTDGAHNLQVSQTDLIGNTSALSPVLSVTVDTLAPTLTVNIVDASLRDGHMVSNVTFEFNEEVSGFAAGDVTVAGGVLSDFTQVDGNSYTAVFTAVDGFETTGSVAVGTGYTDLVGNTGTTGSDTVSIDTANPTVVSVTANDLLITDADAVTDTFSIAVVFDQAMNAGVAPTLTFAPTVASTLTLTGGVWSVGNTVYTASYNVADANVEVSNVTVDVTGAQDVNGNAQVNYTPLAEFSIDTTNPVGAGETILVNNDPTAGIPEWLLLLNDSNGAVDLQNGPVGTATNGTATHTDGGNGTGSVVFDFTGASTSGSFVYNVVDAAGNTSSATATITRPSTATDATINGTAGADILFGGAGSDTLQGGSGNDTYAFRLSGDGIDAISDTAGADQIRIGSNGAALSMLNFSDSNNGTNNGDLVISYNGQQITVQNHFNGGTGAVEVLTFVGGGTYAGYDLGSSSYNISSSDPNGTPRTVNLSASTANNIVAGEAGVDSMTGGSGKDLLFGNDGADNTLSGGAGSDLLSGGLGNDTLTGGADNDTFVFNTVLAPSSNVDNVTDFKADGTDTIALSTAIFGGIGSSGTLNSANFYSGGAGTDTVDVGNAGTARIIYDSSTGSLFYDSDGGTSANRTEFADITLDGGTFDFNDVKVGP